jgi:hypothetical protein
MHLYWRIQQDLNCMGELIVFHDPCFIRRFRQWARKNAAGLAVAEGFSLEDLVRPSLN